MTNEAIEKLKAKIAKDKEKSKKAKENFEKSKKALEDKQKKIHNARVIEIGELILKELGEDFSNEDLNAIISMFKELNKTDVVAEDVSKEDVVGEVEEGDEEEGKG